MKMHFLFSFCVPFPNEMGEIMLVNTVTVVYNNNLRRRELRPILFLNKPVGRSPRFVRQHLTSVMSLIKHHSQHTSSIF